eukprot:jgi/Ulvmu1/1607/UM111_0036.1
MAEAANDEVPVQRPATVSQDPKQIFKAMAGPMVARRAFRRYHGTWRHAACMENSGPILLLAVMWGLYSMEVGDIQPCGASDVLDPNSNSGRDAGLSIRFVWAYTSNSSRVGAIIAAAIYVTMSYLIIKYQRSLNIRWCTWVTGAVVLGLLGMAIEAVVHDVEDGKNLQQRQELVWAWIVVQSLLLAVGFFRKKLLPRLNKAGHLIVLDLRESRIEEGASADLVELWERYPPLKAYLESQYRTSDSKLISFKGKYVDSVTCSCTGGTAHTAIYVGGLDANGAPHGIGAWADSYKHGEVLFGLFQHGVPVAPMRTRTNNGSSTIAYRVALLSCRTNPTDSTGSFRGSTPATPLLAGVASVECCTCGLFYKGFPRVTWLQEPAPLPSDAVFTAGSGVDAVSVEVNGSSDKQKMLANVAPVPSRHDLLGAHTDVGPADIRSLSPWIFTDSDEILGAQHAAGARPGYDALLFIHGFNSDIDGVVRLVGQLLSLGSFPASLMPTIFGWPCTRHVAYPMGHKVVKSEFVRNKFDAALQCLKADGCSRVHILAHSMGARVLAGVSQRLADIFAPSPNATEPRRSSVAPQHPYEEFALGSVIMLSPDMDLGEFAGHTGPLLRSVCDNVVIYGDEHDSALNYATIGNGMLFKRYPDMAMPGLAENCAKLGVPIGSSLGRHCQPVPKVGGGVLDVDVVVTSHLQSNMHGMRHNYFHPNHEMVCDLRDVIVDGSRARDRVARLEVSGPNVFSFLVAPPYVVAG